MRICDKNKKSMTNRGVFLYNIAVRAVRPDESVTIR